MKKLATALSLLVIAALLVFVVQNLHTTEVQFLGWEAKLSLAFPIIGAYILGGLSARRLFRLLNGQRKQHKTDKKAKQSAEAKLQKEQAQASENKVRR